MTPFLLAFTEFFVNPWLLSGLSLLAAPVIIHLMNKRRFQIVEWAAMDFLFQAQAENRRRIRLEDLLLLLFRLLLIALLVFALARPVMQAYVGGREDERVLVVDDSASMETSGATGVPMILAQSAAARQVEDSIGSGTSLRVWLGTRREEISALDVVAEKVDSEAATSSEAVAAADALSVAAQGAEILRNVRSLRSTDASLRVARLLGRLQERFESVDQPLLRTVFLFSDFRTADWTMPDLRGLRPEIEAAVAGLDEAGTLDRVQWNMVNVGDKDRENLTIRSVKVLDDIPSIHAPVRLRVEVANTGVQVRREVHGGLDVGEPDAESAVVGGAPIKVLRRVPFPAIDVIPAGAAVSVDVELSFSEAGEYPILLRLENTGDRLRSDDTTYCVLGVREAVRVLLVDGDPGSDRWEGEAGFLAAALAPRGPLPSGVSFQTTRNSLPRDLLRESDVVFILNRANWSDQEVESLSAFVRRGGGLAFFVGNRVQADEYNRVFKRLAAVGDHGASDQVASEQFASDPGAVSSSGLFPVTLRPPAAAQQSFHLRITDEAHGAFAVFRGVEGSSIEKVAFDRFFAVEPRPGARVIAEFDDEARTPAIVEMVATPAVDAAPEGSESVDDDSVDGASKAPSGSDSLTSTVRRSDPAGKVVVFNLTADRDWNDWPTDPSFLVVIQEWVRYLTPRQTEARRIVAGEAMSWEWTPGFDYEVVTPTGAVATVQPKQIDGQFQPWVSFNETYDAGFYRVRPRERVSGQETEGRPAPFWFACVGDARESHLEAADEFDLEAELKALGMNVLFDRSAGKSDGGGLYTENRGGEIWRALAWATGGVLLLELLLAWWLGRR